MNQLKIQASEAKTHLPELLDRVERGETLIITRHGRAIARLVPEPGQKKEELRRVIAGIKQIGKRNGKITPGELLSARDDGRRF